MNFSFDPMYQPFPSNRFCITAKNGMVASGCSLASAAGLQILQKGGNAVDAAIAAAVCHTVTEPSCNGIGSDTFAIVWIKDKMYGLNSSGYSPRSISIEKLRERGITDSVPLYGWIPVTVPGAPKAWAALSKRFGKLPFEELFEPAIKYAQEGFPLSPVIADSFEKATAKFHTLFDGKPEFDEWFRVFSKNGEPYHFGDIVKLPDHAKTLKLIAKSMADEFYKGEIADAIAAQSTRDGGFLTKEDLSDYDVSWVDPIGVEYRDYKVWEMPPNGQGIAALMALNILNNFEFKAPQDPETYHMQIEAMKIAFADAHHYVTDPDCMPLDYKRLILPEYGRQRAAEIGSAATLPTHKEPPKSGTIYLCTADSEGNMVSLIQSNYRGFGSGIVIEGYGVSMQNRGCGFSMDARDANCLMPHKRSFHTIIPGFLTRNGKAVGPFGIMGGGMQPQAHVQAMMNYIDFGLNPQMALDAPRWQWLEGKTVSVEQTFPVSAVGALLHKGHNITVAAENSSFGRGQMIVRLDNGVLVGGTESRTDSSIASW